MLQGPIASALCDSVLSSAVSTRAVGKRFCLTRTWWVGDLAALVPGSASPKQLLWSSLSGVSQPGCCVGRPGEPAAGHAGVGPAPLKLGRAEHRMGHLLLPSKHWDPAPARHLDPHTATQPPHPTQSSAARAEGVLTPDKFSGCPCDFLGFICASARKFRARRTPPRHVSAAPAASPVLPTNPCSFPHIVVQIFFHVLLPGEGKREKAEQRRGKMWIKNS